MNPPVLKIKKLHPDAILPIYATPGAACFDLYALLPDHLNRRTIALNNMAPCIVRTGLAFEIPAGWSMLIFSRSGHGFKGDVRLANCVGVIDADYTGEVMVKLTSDAVHEWDFLISHGDRIAQAMLVQIPQVQMLEVDALSETERGAGGFGSTGA